MRFVKYFLSALLFIVPVLLRAQYEPKSTGELIRHTYYSLDYNELHEQPNWVCYRLTYDMIKGLASRADDFRADAAVSTGSAELEDYRGSGYDRGHLCPAADMKLSKEAMSETFFLSNMSPQNPSFNRGKWADLEAEFRSFIRDESDTLYIVTGPVFADNKGSVGKNQVTVPGFYYKAAYCPKRGMIGYVMPNRKISETADVWVTSVDIIEALTGIDFFYQLPDESEEQLETAINLHAWKTAGNKADNPGTYRETKKSAPSNPASDKQDASRCKAVTQSGTQCSRRPEPGSDYCWQHKK